MKCIHMIYFSMNISRLPKYYPANITTVSPSAQRHKHFSVGYLCLCVFFAQCPCIFCAQANPRPPPKKKPSPLFLCAPHKYYSHARLTSSHPFLSPSSPLSSPLSLSTHARQFSPSVSETSYKALFFFIFPPLLLEILLGFSSQ